MPHQTDDTVLPRWAWLGVPLAIYFAHYVARAVLDAPVYDAWLLHESGLTEVGTVVVLAMACIGGVVATVWAFQRGDRVLAGFFALFSLGCLYFGGEEASWGQHWFGWATPDQWRALNNQAETNLHNSNSLAGSLLDQLPRNLLAIAMLVGGCILPIRRWLRGRSYAQGSFGYWAMPTFDCVVIGFVAPLASIPEKLFEAALGDVPYPFDIDGGEVKELMFAVFLCLYIVTVLVRIRRKAITPRPSAA
ncbi:hypothetical protein [uncultured Salinisphaera sp.]|jgi:hypothetical protein|uniref:hypothetical protein n=1 Tax=uncultured Salinisphaera sp. TaxID=359372 RepID=UPI0032B2C639|tara:strand:+ start:149 stop:892 length:744 start_codon:yes stop_codon:yes gene_type:complete